MKKKVDWFKTKSYCHIGLPLTQKDRCKVSAYIHNKENIKKHAFYPLIKITQKKNKYTTATNKAGEKIRVKKAKIRELCYATHFDSAIYSFYALQMNIKYDDFLKENNISDNVTAYRTITKANGQGKCNIDFAKEVFDFIATKHEQRINMAAITFDIKGFFDNLDHIQLKEALKKLYGVDKLEDDLYAIYKNAINYSFIHQKDLFNLFSKKIICKNKKNEEIKRHVKQIKHLRKNNAVAFCERKDFNEIRDARIIKKDKGRKERAHKGIPQGLPISAVLANIYMMDFDKNIISKICCDNVLYRRYSDDIVVVCPQELVGCIKKIVFESIKKTKLEIETSKTNVFYFIRKFNNAIECHHSTRGTNKPFEYLGFSFDGKRALLKQASIASYYQRMQTTLQRMTFFASTIQNKDTRGKIFTNQAVKRFTRKGARRHKVYKRQKQKDGTYSFVCSGRKSLGNFHTYVNKSVDIFQSDHIKPQMRHNLKNLKKKIAIAKKEVQRRVDNKRNYETNTRGKTHS